MANDKPIGLKELIERVKSELLAEHDETQPLLAIGQLELTIAFTAERTAQGGINLQVVQLGGQRGSSEVQTVMVRLEPLVSVEEVRNSLTPEQVLEITKRVTREYEPQHREGSRRLR